MDTTHEMRRLRIRESGLEEWACPTCSRRILLRWPPDYRKQVIDPGDEQACHVGTDPHADDPTGHHPGHHTGHHTGAPAGGRAPSQPYSGTGRYRWLRETGVEAASAAR